MKINFVPDVKFFYKIKMCFCTINGMTFRKPPCISLQSDLKFQTCEKGKHFTSKLIIY